MTTANYLTFFRILISPFFLLIYLNHDFLGISTIALPYVLIVLLGISKLSDAYDGYHARKYNQVTDLGKVLDPMADSITIIAVFLTFTLPPVSLPMPLVFVFIYRDSIISTLRTICALKGVALAANNTGKIKTVIQAFTAFFVLILMIPFSLGLLSQELLHFWSTLAISIAAMYAAFSAGLYFYINRHHIKKFL